jgi:predicted small lipoprotein YifL
VTRRAFLLVLLAACGATLGACGKKSSLEPPPDAQRLHQYPAQ